MYSLEFLCFYVLRAVRLNVLNDTERFQPYDLLICLYMFSDQSFTLCRINEAQCGRSPHRVTNSRNTQLYKRSRKQFYMVVLHG